MDCPFRNIEDAKLNLIYCHAYKTAEPQEILCNGCAVLAKVEEICKAHCKETDRLHELITELRYAKNNAEADVQFFKDIIRKII